MLPFPSPRLEKLCPTACRASILAEVAQRPKRGLLLVLESIIQEYATIQYWLLIHAWSRFPAGAQLLVRCIHCPYDKIN